MVSSVAEELPVDLIGKMFILQSDVDELRLKIEEHFDLGPKDGTIVVVDNRSENSQYEDLLSRHEQAMGLYPLKVFLSHKGLNKLEVRQYKDASKLLGFDPWLDEDAMSAGTPFRAWDTERV